MFKFLKKLKYSIPLFSITSLVTFYSFNKVSEIYKNYNQILNKNDIEKIIYKNIDNKNLKELEKILKNINEYQKIYNYCPLFLQNLIPKFDQEHFNSVINSDVIKNALIYSNDDLNIIKLMDKYCSIDYSKYKWLYINYMKDDVFEYFYKEKQIYDKKNNEKAQHCCLFFTEQNIIDRILKINVNTLNDLCYFEELMLNDNLSFEQYNTLIEQMPKDNEEILFKNLLWCFRPQNKNCIIFLKNFIENNKDKKIILKFASRDQMIKLLENNLIDILDFIIENNDIEYTKRIIERIYVQNIYESWDYSERFKLNETSKELFNYLKSKNIEIPDINKDSAYRDLILKEYNRYLDSQIPYIF